MKTQLFPEMDDKKKLRETTRIDFRGKMSVCTIDEGEFRSRDYEAVVHVEAYRCHEEGKSSELKETMDVEKGEKDWKGKEVPTKVDDFIHSYEKYKFGLEV